MNKKAKKSDKSDKEDSREKYDKTCQFIEGHLRRQGANAAGIQQTGKRIAWIQRHGGFRFDNFDTFEQWREQKLKFSAEWTAKYMLIGSAYKVQELTGKQLGVQALAAIATLDKDRVYRATLLKHGQRHEATVIRSALRRARMCSTVEKGNALLVSILQRPESDGQGRTRVSSASLPLTQHLSRCKNRLTAVLSEVRSLRQRIAGGEELSDEDRHSLSARLAKLVTELWDVNQFISQAEGQGAAGARDPHGAAPAIH